MNKKLCLITLSGLMLALSACGPMPPEEPPYLAGSKDSLTRANYWYKRGCHEEAGHFYTEALNQARLSDRVTMIIKAQNGLGTNAMAMGKFNQAAAYLEKAWEISVAQPGQPELPQVLSNLGTLSYKIGRLKDAEDFWKKSQQAALDKQGDPSPALANLARLYQSQNQTAEFIKSAQDAFKHAQAHKNPDTTADAHNLMGQIALADGRQAEAIAHFEAALAIDRQLENQLALAQDLNFMGQALMAVGRHQEAFSHFDRAFYLWASQGDQKQMKAILNNITSIQKITGTPQKLAPYEEAIKNPQKAALSSGVCP